MGSSLTAIVRVLADDAVQLAGLKVGTGHDRDELGELSDRNAPEGGHVIADLAGLCLGVKVTSDITGDDRSQTAGRDKVQTQTEERAK
jgi:hypothetical protein